MFRDLNREVRLLAYPRGLPTAADFALVPTETEPLQDQQVLVRNRFFSVEPYMRGRMNPGESYMPPFGLGRALDGRAVGEVVESRADGFRPGDTVVSLFGWRERFVAPASALRRLAAPLAPLSAYLGALGMTGMTAWVGLNLAKVKAGDTVYISGAAGAVGHVAGQLARMRGCRVIGSAGSAEERAFLSEFCGFDAVFDVLDGPLSDQLARHAPEGIDVYFDTAGEALDAALAALRVQGRIVACGSILAHHAAAPTNLFLIVTKRLTLQGFAVTDWADQQDAFEQEVGGYLREGSLQNQETIVQGIEHAVDAFLGLFHGHNTGKMVVEVGRPHRASAA